MENLLILQAKPNPVGKDKYRFYAPPSQLAGEWVDIENTGDLGISLEEIKLHHIAYTATHPNGIWEEVMSFTGVLGSGKIMRVHSGGKILLDEMLQVDRLGADYHLFTGKNYVWNNDRSDSPRLIKKIGLIQIQEIDKATYKAYPPEGRILKRNYSILE